MIDTTEPRLLDNGAPVPYPGEFLRVIIGSTIHGLHVAGTDDLDLMGVKIERPEESFGLDVPFHQHTWRTQPEGVPSGPGDVDITVYTLRKYLQLAANGNPTVLNLLFVPQESRHIDGGVGESLRKMTPKIISRAAADRYRHYLAAQRERLLGLRGQKHTGYTRRQKYLATVKGEEPWDSKYAMHMIRLGVQGVELMQTGRISLPMQEPLRSQVFDVRLGKVPMADCVEWAKQLEAQLDHLAVHADLPPEPDRATLEKWLVHTYLNAWEDQR